MINLSKSYGVAANPLRITSLQMSQMATIQVANDHGVFVSSFGVSPLGLGIVIDHLVIQGNQGLKSSSLGAAGVYIHQDSSLPLDYALVSDLDVSGFSYAGVVFDRLSNASPYITNAQVKNVVSHDNPGYTSVSSGNGIIMSGVQGASVINCETYNNGARSFGNPSNGVSVQDADSVTVDGCSSHDNLTADKEGGGFGVGFGSTNVLMINCVSKDNFGPAYLVAAMSDASLNYQGSVANILFKNSTSTDDCYGYKYEILGVWTDGIASAFNITYQDMVATSSFTGVTFYQWGANQGLSGLWLDGLFDAVYTKGVSFSAPNNVDFSCDLTCTSNPYGCVCSPPSSAPVTAPTSSPSTEPTVTNYHSRFQAI